MLGEIRVFEVWAAVCVLTLAITLGAQKLNIMYGNNSAATCAQEIVKDTMYAQRLAEEEQTPVHWQSQGNCSWTVRLDQLEAYRHSKKHGMGDDIKCAANTGDLIFDERGQLNKSFTFKIKGGNLIFVIHITRWGYLTDHVYSASA
jgi:hypothetical protein